MIQVVPSSYKPSYNLSAGATYLITGGMVGLGRSIAKRMASRGAKSIILLSRSGLDHPGAKELVDELDAGGITLVAPKCHVSK
jgi:NAD(P)-dependent dehydrogenase (short-subunit alcohol dehydrogenase family)